jgi:lysophospholipase L1-like esterase
MAVGNDPGIVAENLLLLGSLRSAVVAGGARLAIVYVPFRYTLRAGEAASAPRELRTWAQVRGVAFLDTTRCLSGRGLPEVTLDGVHLTVLGHRVVASEIEGAWSDLAGPRGAPDGRVGAGL